MSSSPRLPSPPPKRLKSGPADSLTSVEEAPVKALFIPQAESEAGPSKPPQTSNFNNGNGNVKAGKGKQKRRKLVIPDQYSAGDVSWHDIQDFLGPGYVNSILERKDKSEWDAPDDLELQSTIELRVGAFTVSGESLSLYESTGQKWAILVPFAHPGDLIKVKIFKHDRLHSHADLLEILEYNEEFRGGEGDRRKYPSNGCKYFGECGGCQFQPIPYPLQLLHKRKTVQLAYQRFFGLNMSIVPEIGETIGSPKQWGYRTKITPHFDALPKAVKAKYEQRQKENEEKLKLGQVNGGLGEEVEGEEAGMNGDIKKEEEGKEGKEETVNGMKEWEVRIGFERKGRPGVMDIEECPIATSVLNERLKIERKRIKETIHTFKRGATLLLRDSLEPPNPIPSLNNPYKPTETRTSNGAEDVGLRETYEDEKHVAIIDHHQNVYERVGDYLFTFSAGSFFQNNNSILEPLLEYVKTAIFSSPPPSPLTSTSDIPPHSEHSESPISTDRMPVHLIDTYCGSGLFGISLSKHFKKVIGIEISQQSIEAARKNAGINGLKEDKAEWIVGKSEEIFGGLGGKGFKGEGSCVIIDPPRKGCDEQFLKQLIQFKPVKIVYVSCNVHTQARDVGWFIMETEKLGIKYELISVRGFDLFPQTAHVESVAVLQLRS